MKSLLALATITVFTAIIWTLTQDWVESRRAKAIAGAVTPAPAGPGPNPAI